MADASDVENALVSIVAGLLYPNGTAQPSSVTAPCRVFRGWPVSNRLDSDLRNGVVNVSVCGVEGTDQNVTRHISVPWEQISMDLPTVTVSRAGNVITFGGTISVPQWVTVIVSGRAYSYGLLVTDTLSTLAAGLATLISANWSASSVGPVLTVGNGMVTDVRIGRTGNGVRIRRRQSKTFQISVWASSPDLRDTVAKKIDEAGLAPIVMFPLADYTSAKLEYIASHTDDSAQEELLWRRDLRYSVEYSSVETELQYQITSVPVSVQSDIVSGPPTTVVTP